MRMIGIGLLGFLLAGIALLLSTMNLLEKGQRYVREVASGPQLVFEHRTATRAQDRDTAVILRANPDHPVILSGFPAYQGIAFNMPMDARPTSGYLQIDATSQVLDGVEGVLRISIRNTRRGEMLLRPGEVGRSLQIPLSPTDFAGNQLVVSFSLQGTGPQDRCTQDGGIQAMVEIETTSAIYLTLDRPLTSARDRVQAWGDMVRVAWPGAIQADEQVRRLVLASTLKQRDIRTVFDPSSSQEALGSLALRDVLMAFPDTAPPVTAFPRPLAISGLNAGVRRFHRKAVWRERYALRDHTDQQVPAHLDLHMIFGRLTGTADWTLTVTLNNRLVFQDAMAGSTTAYQARVTLPAAMQSSSNQIEITAATTAPQSGLCDHGPELVAEMLPRTALIPGDASYLSSLAELRNVLSKIDTIRVATASPLTAIDANMASDWLSGITPARATLTPARDTAHIMVLTPDSPAMTVPPAAWWVTQDAATNTLSVHPLAPGTTSPRGGPGLLVVPGTLDLNGVAS